MAASKEYQRRLMEGLQTRFGGRNVKDDPRLRAALGRFEDRDVASSLRESTMGEYDAFREGLNEDLTAYRGASVGAGRLDTGFAQGGEDRLIRSGQDRLSRALQQNALQAEGMQMSNDQALLSGEFGLEDRDFAADEMYLEGMAGGRDYEVGEENRQRERKTKRKSLLGGLIGGAGGFFLGGPAGAAAGYKAGSTIGGSL